MSYVPVSLINTSMWRPCWKRAKKGVHTGHILVTHVMRCKWLEHTWHSLYTCLLKIRWPTDESFTGYRDLSLMSCFFVKFCSRTGSQRPVTIMGVHLSTWWKPPRSFFVFTVLWNAPSESHANTLRRQLVDDKRCVLSSLLEACCCSARSCTSYNVLSYI